MLGEFVDENFTFHVKKGSPNFFVTTIAVNIYPHDHAEKLPCEKKN